MDRQDVNDHDPVEPTNRHRWRANAGTSSGDHSAQPGWSIGRCVAQTGRHVCRYEHDHGDRLMVRHNRRAVLQICKASASALDPDAVHSRSFPVQLCVASRRRPSVESLHTRPERVADAPIHAQLIPGRGAVDNIVPAGYPRLHRAIVLESQRQTSLVSPGLSFAGATISQHSPIK